MAIAPNGDNSLSDVHQALSNLSDEAWERFRLVAKYQLFRFAHLDPRDLVSETALRFLDGRRTWPKGLPFAVVFYNGLRSVADEFRDAEMSKLTIAMADLEPNANGEAPPLDCLAVDSRTPARAVEASQLIERVFDKFAHDQDVEAVLVGRMEGQTAEEVQAAFAMTANEYHAARKRLEHWIREQSANGARS